MVAPECSMLAAQLTSDLEFNLRGSVRNARPGDAGDVMRLAGTLAPSPGDLASVRHGHVLVYEVDGCVRAAAQLVIDPGRKAHVRLLVVDEAVGARARTIEERMFGVAIALCEAYGCTEVDIAATGRNDIDAAQNRRGSRA